MQRILSGPILTREDIPSRISPLLRDVTSVFNPGAAKVVDGYFLMLRVQNRGRRTFFLGADSTDGVNFCVRDHLIEIIGIPTSPKVYHCYDPRVTTMTDEPGYIIIFAMDCEDGCHLGVVRSLDLRVFQWVGWEINVNSRNGVMFPHKIGGKYARLERPNNKIVLDGPKSGDAIVYSVSDDLISWQQLYEVCAGNRCFWDEYIGSGPPPIKTRQGWIHIYHGIATHYAPIYQAGVLLLALEEPWRVLKRGSQNILEPREMWELTGQVPNVVFPSGVCVDAVDEEGYASPTSKVRVYYGAADTVIGAAECTIEQLLEWCDE